MTDSTNSWGEWSRHVLAELERLNQNINSIHVEIQQLRTDVVQKSDYLELRKDFERFKIRTITDLAVLKTKSAIIGAVSGTIVGGIVTILVSYLT